MTAVTRSKRLSSKFDLGEKLSFENGKCINKSIITAPRSCSIQQARARFVAVAECALSDLISAGHSRENAAEVLTKSISVGGPPSDDDVFGLMNRSGIQRGEALRALTVAKALKELRSRSSDSSICTIGSIDALTNLVNKKCDLCGGMTSSQEGVQILERSTISRFSIDESSSGSKEFSSSPQHKYLDKNYSGHSSEVGNPPIYSSNGQELDHISNSISRSTGNKRKISIRNDLSKGKSQDVEASSAIGLNPINLNGKLDDDPNVLSKSKSPPLKNKRGSNQALPPNKRVKNGT